MRRFLVAAFFLAPITLHFWAYFVPESFRRWREPPTVAVDAIVWPTGTSGVLRSTGGGLIEFAPSSGGASQR